MTTTTDSNTAKVHIFKESKPLIYFEETGCKIENNAKCHRALLTGKGNQKMLASGPVISVYYEEHKQWTPFSEKKSSSLDFINEHLEQYLDSVAGAWDVFQVYVIEVA